MRRVLLAASAIAPLLCATAWAETEPVPSKADSRIRTAAYNPMQVLKLVATGYVPIEIVYEPGEKIVTVSGPNVVVKPSCDGLAGDEAEKCRKTADNWEPPGKNVWVAVISDNTLTLDPETGGPDTVLLVRNDQSGSQRLYRYHLGTRGGDITDPKKDKNAYMSVAYTGYPHRSTPQEIAAAQARQEAWAERRAQERIVQSRAAMPQDDDYEKRGSGCPIIAPRRTTNDGGRMTLVFAPGTQIPSVLQWVPDGTREGGHEASLTPTPETTAEGLKLTLPTVYSEIRLRYGDLVCALRPTPLERRTTPQPTNSATVPAAIRTARQP